MKAFLCIAALTSLTLTAGCGTARLFSSYDLPESPDVETAPWPALVDTPDAPPIGSPGVPDAAIGMATAADLGQAARDAERRAAELDAPVLSPAARTRLTQSGRTRE